jgi:N-acetylglucosamine-6-phosphate deacetylase
MIIQSKRVWIQEQWIPAQLTLDGGRITAISALDTQKPDIDYGNLRILPGFIDTHCHGAFGFDTNDADPNGLKAWLAKAPQEGLTIVCPTTITQSETVLTTALRNVAAIATQNPQGARIGGVHFEGPYLNVAYKGAQPEPFIVKPDLDQFKRYQEASGHRIKVMTMAAENDAQFELTRYASADGVFVNLGHSASTYDEAVMAFANGASGLTHTFNAMTPFNHRQPGLVGAALRLGDAYAEIISDGNHVSWPAINVLFKAKGKDRCVLITDALCVKGVQPGQYIFGGQTIDVRPNGGAYLSGSNTLAGSTLTYNDGLRNLIEHARVDEVSAINACTTNPAHVLGLGNVTGKIKVHYWADLTVIDEDYAVQATYVNGERVFTV